MPLPPSFWGRVELALMTLGLVSRDNGPTALSSCSVISFLTWEGAESGEEWGGDANSGRVIENFLFFFVYIVHSTFLICDWLASLCRGGCSLATVGSGHLILTAGKAHTLTTFSFVNAHTCNTYTSPFAKGRAERGRPW